MAKHRIRAAALAVALVFAGQVFAGPGGSGMTATMPMQVTQQAKLVASYAQQVNQYVVTYQQYMTMLQNLNPLALAAYLGVSQLEVGVTMKDLKVYGQALQSVNQSYKQVMQTKSNVENAANRLGTTPFGYMQSVQKGAEQNIKFFVDQQAHFNRVGDQFQQDGERLKEVGKKVEKVTGNLEGHQATAAAVMHTSQMIGDLKLLTSQEAAMAARDREMAARNEMSARDYLIKQATAMNRAAGKKVELTEADREAVREVSFASCKAMQGAEQERCLTVQAAEVSCSDLSGDKKAACVAGYTSVAPASAPPASAPAPEVSFKSCHSMQGAEKERCLTRQAAEASCSDLSGDKKAACIAGYL